MIDEKLEPNDVVISSRIRLARNIAEFPFVNTCSDEQRAEIESVVRGGLTRDEHLSQISFVDSADLDELERRFLLDLKLVSVPAVDDTLAERPMDATLPPADESGDAVNRESAKLESALETLAAIDDASLTINEEDHLRITVTRNDLDLESAWDQITELDDRIEQQFHYAFSPRWGYLTACPANVGTGMRVSVLVHLPALAKTGQLDKVFRSLQRINVVARGVFGEKAVGDFYRISNQATLGIKESDLIEQVTSVIPSLVKYEREAREFLLVENREGLRREVALALEQLCKSDLEDDSEVNHNRILTLLSKVRMGVATGLIGQKDANRVNHLFVLVQLRHRLLAAVAREEYRVASSLRDQIERLEQGVRGSHIFNQKSFAKDELDEGDTV